MSSAHDAHSHTPSNEDDVNMKKILGVGIISLVIFALSAVVAYIMLKADTNTLQAATGVSQQGKLIGKHEIGIVDQVPFDEDRRLEEWQAVTRKKLTTYGWVDRSKGIIRVPIDQAMNDLIKQSTSGAPQ